MPTPSRQVLEKCAQSIDVYWPTRRKLIEHGSERGAKPPRAREEALDRFGRILQFLHVRQKAARLHCIEEPARNAAPPRGKHRRFRQPIKRVVDLDCVESGRVEPEPA